MCVVRTLELNLGASLVQDLYPHVRVVLALSEHVVGSGRGLDDQRAVHGRAELGPRRIAPNSRTGLEHGVLQGDTPQGPLGRFFVILEGGVLPEDHPATVPTLDPSTDFVENARVDLSGLH